MKLESITTAVIIGLLLAGFTWAAYELKEKGRNIEIIKQEKIETKVKDEIIEDKKQVTIRKAISRAVPTSDNLSWLQSNRCKDCQS
jgi:hypothetical protein